MRIDRVVGANTGDDKCRQMYPELVEIASALNPQKLVQVETDIGPLWLRTDDAVMTPWITYYRSWEKETTAFLRESLTVGMHVIDIGANIGYHTLVCAHAVTPSGTVLSLEPEPTNYAVLCANLWHAHMTNVTPLRAAASRHTGQTRLSLSDTNMGDHRTLYNVSWERAIDVACMRIDDFLEAGSPIDLAKLDIQGSEHVAIHGMESMIAQYHPLLVVEFWPLGIRELGDDPAAVLAYYRDIGYEISVLELPHLDESDGFNRLIASIEALQGGFGTLILRCN
jgi:FkbM family methyltransferase